jgi:hypothetical protein
MVAAIFFLQTMHDVDEIILNIFSTLNLAQTGAAYALQDRHMQPH